MSDALGRTPVVGDLYVVIGDVLKRDTSAGLLVIGPGNRRPVIATEAECIRLDDLIQIPSWDFDRATTISTASINLYRGSILANPGGGMAVGTPFPITLTHAWVNCEHSDGSPPASWDLKVVKNSASTGAYSSSLAFTWNASTSTEEITSGALSTEIDIDPGDYWWPFCDGSAIQSPRVRARICGRIRA